MILDTMLYTVHMRSIITTIKMHNKPVVHWNGLPGRVVWEQCVRMGIMSPSLLNQALPCTVLYSLTIGYCGRVYTLFYLDS